MAVLLTSLAVSKYKQELYNVNAGYTMLSPSSYGLETICLAQVPHRGSRLVKFPPASDAGLRWFKMFSS